MADTTETGSAAVEYSILLSAIAGVIVFIVYGVGLNTIKGMQTVLHLWP